MQRRYFMRLGLVGAALPGMVLGAQATSKALHWLRVKDAWAVPLVSPGDWLAADVDVNAFAGEGIYLYPAWGEPRPYLVRAVEQGAGHGVALEFSNPATGRVLWTDTGRVDFAGQVCGCVSPGVDARPDRLPTLRPLNLPRLPA